MLGNEPSSNLAAFRNAICAMIEMRQDHLSKQNPAGLYRNTCSNGAAFSPFTSSDLLFICASILPSWVNMGVRQGLMPVSKTQLVPRKLSTSIQASIQALPWQRLTLREMRVAAMGEILCFLAHRFSTSARFICLYRRLNECTARILSGTNGNEVAFSMYTSTRIGHLNPATGGSMT